MVRPNIQIDDEVREMTDEEYETWLAAAPGVSPFEGEATDGNQ